MIFGNDFFFQILWRNLKWYAFKWDSIHSSQDPFVITAAPNVDDVQFHPRGIKVTWKEVRLEVSCHTCFYRVQLCAECYQPFPLSLKITHKPICERYYPETHLQRKHYRSFAFLDMRELHTDPNIYS